MRKVFEHLDDEERAVLLKCADLGTAVFCSALVVSAFKNIIGLFT